MSSLGWGSFLTGLTNSYMDTWESKRRDRYQSAMEKQWLEQQARAERERQDRIKELEEERAWRAGAPQREKDLIGYRHKLDTEAAERDNQRIREGFRRLSDHLISTNQFDTPDAAERARAALYAASDMGRDPSALLNDIGGIKKRVDPNTAANTAAMLTQREQMIAARREAEKRQWVNTQLAAMGGGAGATVRNVTARPELYAKAKDYGLTREDWWAAEEAFKKGLTQTDRDELEDKLTTQPRLTARQRAEQLRNQGVSKKDADKTLREEGYDLLNPESLPNPQD